MRDHHTQRWREARRLGRPVGEKRGGRNQEARRGVRLASIERQKQGEDLNGLAKTHVVGEAGAETELDEKGQPAYADLLIGS